MAIFTYCCYSGYSYLIFGWPGASTLAPRGPFWKLGVTLGDLGAAEEAHEVQNQNCISFGMISDSFLRAFWGQMGSIMFCFQV